MNDLQGQPAELHFTLTIQRANGKVETFALVGTVQEEKHDDHALDTSAERGD
jgi:hypothetical protein